MEINSASSNPYRTQTLSPGKGNSPASHSKWGPSTTTFPTFFAVDPTRPDPNLNVGPGAPDPVKKEPLSDTRPDPDMNYAFGHPDPVPMTANKVPRPDPNLNTAPGTPDPVKMVPVELDRPDPTRNIVFGKLSSSIQMQSRDITSAFFADRK